jgi:GT2 family glycosyltransferase
MSDKKIGVVSAKLLYPDGKIQSCCQKFPSLILEFMELFRIQKILSPKQRSQALLGAFFDHQSEIYTDWVWGTFFMIKSEVINQLPEKKLPEDFFMYGEDMLWCYYIGKKLKYNIFYFPQAQVIHLLSSSSQKANFNKQLAMLKNEQLFMKKFYGNLHTWLIIKLRAIKYLSIREFSLFRTFWNL